MLEVFTDGACSLVKPTGLGPGGWAWAIQNGPERSGYEPSTTNQRMEMTAVLMALRQLPGPMTIVTDSAYVSNCFRDCWYLKWRQNGWVNSTKQPVANRDLWEPMIELVLDKQVGFRHIRGHQGIEMNEYVDKLCVAAKQMGMARD